MNPTRDKVNSDKVFTFNTKTSSLKLRAISLCATLWGDECVECRLTIATHLQTLQKIEGMQFFAINADTKMAPAEPPFESASPVLIEMRLDPDLLGALPLGAQAILDAIEAGQFPGLLDSENWFALNVKQQNGPVLSGYQTTWFALEQNPVDVKDLSLMAQVVDYMNEQRWHFQQRPESKEVLRLKYEGKSGTWECWATTQEELGFFVFYSETEWKVPENRRSAVAELLCRLNFDLSLGNLEMDFEDGSLRMRTGIDSGENPLTPLLSGIILSNLALFDQVLPSLQTVALSEALAQDVMS